MAGRSDLLRDVSVYVDSVIVTFRGVIESFIAVWTFVRLFSGAMDQTGSSRYSKDRV
jgi:hypothetical protein